MFERKNPSLQKGIDAYKTSNTGDLEGAAVGTVRSAVLEGGQYFDSLMASLRDENITDEELHALHRSIEDQVFEDIVDTLQNPRGFARITGSNKGTAEAQYQRLDELTHHVVIQLYARGELRSRYEGEEPDTEKFREFKATVLHALESNRPFFESVIIDGIRACSEYVQKYPDGNTISDSEGEKVEMPTQINLEMPEEVTEPIGEVINVIQAMRAGNSYVRPVRGIVNDWMMKEYGLGGNGSSWYVGGYSQTFSFFPRDCETLITAMLRSEKVALDKSELENLQTVFRENWKHQQATDNLPLTEWVRRKQGGK